MTFPVIDLISQVFAVEKKLRGKSDREIIKWLQQRGKLYKLKKRSPEEKQLFRFQSHLGIEAIFFIDNAKFFFIGDHYTFRSRRNS